MAILVVIVIMFRGEKNAAFCTVSLYISIFRNIIPNMNEDLHSTFILSTDMQVF